MIEHNKYSAGTIHKIVNHVDDEIYIGSTCQQLNTRMKVHITASKLDSHKSRPLYKHMNTLGADTFYIELVEEFPCDTSKELMRREGHFIKQLSTLNNNIAGRTKKEYQLDTHEHIVEHRRKTRVQHNQQKYTYAQKKDIIAEKSKKRSEHASAELFIE